MAVLRYTLRDTAARIDVQQDWVEEFYDGYVFVTKGRTETNNPDYIMALCQRGFEIVKDETQEAAPSTDQSEENNEPEQTNEPTEQELEEAVKKSAGAPRKSRRKKEADKDN